MRVCFEMYFLVILGVTPVKSHHNGCPTWLQVQHKWTCPNGLRKDYEKMLNPAQRSVVN